MAPLTPLSPAPPPPFPHSHRGGVGLRRACAGFTGGEVRLLREASSDASQGELSLPPPHPPNTLEMTTNPGNPRSAAISRLAGTFILTFLQILTAKIKTRRPESSTVSPPPPPKKESCLVHMNLGGNVFETHRTFAANGNQLNKARSGSSQPHAS